MLLDDVAGAMWRLVSGQALAWRCWDDETVLYNDLSGETHLLGSAAICVLERLRAGPAPAPALASSLMDEFEIDDGDLDTELDSLLGELSRLSLIETCPC